MTIAPQLMVEFHALLHMWGLCLAWASWSCAYCHDYCEFICATALLCSRNSISFRLSTTLALIILPTSLLWNPVSWKWGRYIQFETEHSRVFYSLHAHQLRVSVLIVVYCKEKSLWWGLRVELIYGYWVIRIHFQPCTLSRITGDSPLEPPTSYATGSWAHL